MTIRYSHPPDEHHEGVELLDHVTDVVRRIEFIVPADAQTPHNEPLREVVRSLGFVHDLGKATSYFQQHIGVIDGNPSNQMLREHSPIGAYAAYYSLAAQDYETATCLAGYVAVARHHGIIPDVASYVYNSNDNHSTTRRVRSDAEKRLQAVYNQLLDIDNHVPELGEEIIQCSSSGTGTWEEFIEQFPSIISDIQDQVSLPGTTPGPDRSSLSSVLYDGLLDMWGALLLADKTSAAQAPSEGGVYEPTKPQTRALDEYVAHLEAQVSADQYGSRSERLNYLRSKARKDVIQNIDSFSTDEHNIATITLPTGMGKTLSGLTAAHKLRDKIDGNRIIYALPFTSIIDQVAEEVFSIFDTDPRGSKVTTHHHLAETIIEDIEDFEAADLSDDVGAMLAESWRAGLTITTYVQLFESLAGPQNRQALKIPALRNSVIVLDEPQSLPLDWWKLVPRLVKIGTDQLDATFIAMTATQPELFDKSIPLISNPEHYFAAEDRVSYTFHESVSNYLESQSGPLQYETAASHLLDTTSSTLAICNTIDSSRLLTDQVMQKSDTLINVHKIYQSHYMNTSTGDSVDIREIVDSVASEPGRPLIHLSTRIRPVDRLNLIECAKALRSGGSNLMVISTQLVEAGVDISFEQVFRDFAPIDSIVQAAGRCNRSFESQSGEVQVWWLDSPGDQQNTPAEAVYNRGAALLPMVADILSEIGITEPKIPESQIATDAVNLYYDRLHNLKNVGKEEYVSLVDECRGDELSKLSLIDNRRSIEVIICFTDSEIELVENARSAIANFEFDRATDLLKSTEPIRVSVPVYDSQSSIAEGLMTLPGLFAEHQFSIGSNIRVLQISQNPQYFDTITGLNFPDNNIEHRFL